MPNTLFLPPHPSLAYNLTESIIKMLVSNRMDKAILNNRGESKGFGTQPKTSSHKLPWFDPNLGSTQFKLV